MKRFDIVDDLLKTCRNRKAAIVRNGAEKQVKLRRVTAAAALKIGVSHRELVKVAQQCIISLCICIHEEKPPKPFLSVFCA